VNEHGDITEATIANAVFLIDGVWRTPPVTDGLLAGIMRERLIMSGALKEQSVSIADALGAEAVALVNSVRGWQPALIVESSGQ
jgi:para-aminobenzoate synthetase/4-amino-4-deoxychorismate lyase